MKKAKKNPAAVALGRIKSKAKAAASRANGKLGGRPKAKRKGRRDEVLACMARADKTI